MGDTSHGDGDYFGPAVVEAARLCAAASGGQILLTEVTRILVGRRGEYSLAPIGDLELKGLPGPVATCELVWKPAPATPTALPRVTEPDRDRARPRAQIPDEPDLAPDRTLGARVSSDRFIGREEEMAALGADSGTIVIAGDAGDALARLDAMLAGIPGDRRPPRPVACRTLAAAEITRARGRSDPEAWQVAADAFRALREPYTTAYAEFRQAQALLADGRGAGAALLRDAHSIPPGASISRPPGWLAKQTCITRQSRCGPRALASNTSRDA